MSKRQRTSVKRIIANVIRDMQLDDVSFHIDSMIEWAAEAESFIASFDTFEKVECELDVDNYRAELPCGFYQLISLKVGDKFMEMTNRDFRHFDKSESNTRGNLAVAEDAGEFKYSLDNHFIHISSLKTGKIGISYLAVPTDDEGLPLVLESHEPAIVSYIMWKMKTVDYINGKLALHVYQNLERRWQMLCGQARGNDNMPDTKEMEYIAAVFQQLIPPPTQQEVYNNVPTFKNKY